MAEIQPVSSFDTTQTTGVSGVQSLGKDDFLQLLITKLRYQDPLNPMEDEDFVAQLAQFSNLEQMNNIADGIAQSNEWDFLQMQSLNNVMASGFIGKEVRANFDGVYFDGSDSPEITFTLSGPAAKVEFDIINANGAVVRTLSGDDLLAGTQTIEWNGEDQYGNRTPEGYYTIQARSLDQDGNPGSFQPDLFMVGVVDQVIYRNGVAFLKVNGIEVALGDIEAIGEEGSFSEGDD